MQSVDELNGAGGAGGHGAYTDSGRQPPTCMVRWPEVARDSSGRHVSATALTSDDGPQVEGRKGAVKGPHLNHAGRAPMLSARPSRMLGGLAIHHRLGMMAALLVALAGFGATAFGVAVHIPEPVELPYQFVSELIAPLDTDTQIQTLASHRIDLYHDDVTRSGDTVASLLARLNIADPSAAQFLRNDAASRALFDGQPGKSVRARVDTSGRLIELIARYGAQDRSRSSTHFSRLRVELIAGRFMSMVETAALAPLLKVSSGSVTSSLFAATDAAGMPDAVASQMADVLSGDIDFHRDLRPGDAFAVVYEVLAADGEPVTWSHSPGRLVAAEFSTRGREHSAVWYQEPGTKGGYFSFDGQSKRRAFLASPLEFSRVSSGFSNRIHPLLKMWQQHQGIDYAAPSGTPVRCVGDGMVEFTGPKNGYGNVVEVRHSGGRTTLYAHLRRIDVRVGQRVERGDRLGAVGATGWATGPHLHFEFKVGGVARNPARLAQWSDAAQIGPGRQPDFEAWAKGFRGQVELAQSTVRSGRYAE
jgi:murein DD-endopeptidase MepM/ murein hydrolase activator NlpD